MVQLVDDLCRMRMLVAGVYVGIAISSTYGFSIFTQYLKMRYGFSQSDITTISTVGNCVGYCSFFAGMLFDYAGPTVVLILAGLLGFLGFLLFGLTFDGIVTASPSVLHFSLFNAIFFLGTPSMDVACVMPLMLQFPLDRGYVVIIQKTFCGLGTSVLMAYFNGWFRARNSDDINDNNYSGYAYFLAVQILVCSLVGAYFMRLPAYFPCAWRKKRLSPDELAGREKTRDLYMRQHAPLRRLNIGFLLIIIFLIFSATQSIATAYVRTTHAGYFVIAIIAVLLMVSFSLMALPLQFLGRYTPVTPTNMDAIGKDATADVGEPATPDQLAELESNAGTILQTAETAAQLPQYEGGFWSNLRTLPLWAMWLTCFGMWGTGTVMQMNAAQIYYSKNYGQGNTSMLTLYVAIMAVGSAVGRISMGLFDVKLTDMQRAKRTSILTTVALPLGPLLLAIACLLFALLPHYLLILPFFLGSVGNGVCWGAGLLSMRIMYARDIGKHYNFCISSGIVSTIALNHFMFGGMYDNVARERGEFPLCKDSLCVQNQMYILFGVNLLSTLAGCYTHWRFTRYIRGRSQE